MGRSLSQRYQQLLVAVALAVGLANAHTVTPTQAGTAPARTAWLHAQRAFVAALGHQEEAARWHAYVQALVPYLHVSSLWQLNPAMLQKDLNAPSQIIAYQVQQWRTLVGTIRLVTVTDSGQAFPNLCFAPAHGTLYTLQVLVWADDHGVIRSQPMWEGHGFAPTQGIMVGGNTVLDARAWRSANGTTHVAIIEQTSCGASGWTNAFTGITLPYGATAWQAAPSLFPHNPIDTDQAFKPFPSFLDPAGQRINIQAYFFNKAIGECNGCEHEFAQRIVSRGAGDTYHLLPWHIVPGPYPTLVQAADAAGRAQKAGGISGCTAQTVVGLVLNDQIAAQFCQLDWSSGASWVKKTPDDDGGPHYKHRPITYDLSLGSVVGQNVVHFAVSPVQGAWLITQVTPSSP